VEEVPAPVAVPEVAGWFGVTGVDWLVREVAPGEVAWGEGDEPDEPDEPEVVAAGVLGDSG